MHTTGIRNGCRTAQRPKKKVIALAEEIAGEVLQLFGSVAYGTYEFPDSNAVKCFISGKINSLQGQ